jgi:hypothetical protein
MKVTEDETEELMRLAVNTPSRFSIMTITDTRSGISVKVDQSMDSTFGSEREKFKGFMQEFLNIYFGGKDKKYNGEFDGKHKVQINNLIIDFGSYEGKEAWNWLIRYVTIVINLMDREGVINLKDIEEGIKSGKYKVDKTVEGRTGTSV